MNTYIYVHTHIFTFRKTLDLTNFNSHWDDVNFKIFS